MLKPLLNVSRVAAAIAVALAASGLGGCATHPTPAHEQTAQSTPQNPECVQDTGTRIQQPEGTCRNVPGSSYTQTDIQRTGELDTAKALQKLDPRLSAGH